MHETGTSGPIGLRERKRLRTKQTIARVALDLFERQGFHATTLAQIAGAADVSPRTVSGYFPEKEGLLFPDQAQELQSLDARLRDRQAGETATDALRAWIGRWVSEQGERATERRARRRVIRSEQDLRAYEHRYLVRGQEIIAAAFAHDLGASPDDLESRMAAAATVTIFDLLGEDSEVVDPAEMLAVVDRALIFIGGGIQALRRA
jgi:AcrR family transcriptional regulator